MRTVHIFFVTVLLAAAPSVALAALGGHQWSSGWNAGGLARPDGSGHIAAAGTIFSATNFGGGTLTPANIFGGDMFLARFNNAGAHVWSLQFTPGGFGVIIDAVAAAPDGTIYVAGRFQNGDINFGGGVLSGVNDAWLAAFNSAGSHLWSFVVGTGTIRDLAANNSFVACTGYSNASLDFGGGTLTTAGNQDMFIAAVNANGTHRFSQIHGAAAGDTGGMSVAVGPSSEIVVLASTEDAVDFGGGALTPSGLDTEPCLMEFDSNGVHQWSWTTPGSFSPGAGVLLAQHVAVSSTGEIALVGEFEASVNMGGGNLTSAGSFDVFVARYNTNGAHLSSVNYGGSAHDEAHGVAYDSADNIGVVGNFRSASVGFGGGTLTHSGGSSANFFTAIYDPSAAHVFSGSYSGGGAYDIGAYFNSADGLLLTGVAGGGIDFGGGGLGSANLYMATLEGSNPPTPTSSPMRPTFLAQNSPNPFNPTTRIRFELPRAGRAALKIFDARGRLVREWSSSNLPAGEHDFFFDGRDGLGRSLASGIYHYSLHTQDARMTRSMVLIK